MSAPPITTDPDEIAREASRRLSSVYGDRLHSVVLFGSWARGEAAPDSDLDLIVVLDDPGSVFAEIHRMGEIFWDLTMEVGVTVSAIPVSIDDYEMAETAFLQRVRTEGRPAA